MNKSSLLKSIFLVATGSVLVTGCVTREKVVYRQAPPPPPGEEIIVSEPPPPPLVETVVVSPGPSYVWVGGGWAWHNRWVWESGHWAHPPHEGAVWVSHRYVRHNGVNVYVHGYWR